jgi:hypothetical protein
MLMCFFLWPRTWICISRIYIRHVYTDRGRSAGSGALDLQVAARLRRHVRPPARRIGDSVVSSRPCTYVCGCNRPCPACLHLIPNAIWEHTRAVRPHSHHHTRHTVNRQLKLNFASEFFRVSTYVLYNFFVVIKFFM